jgi:hypothetical protein
VVLLEGGKAELVGAGPPAPRLGVQSKTRRKKTVIAGFMPDCLPPRVHRASAALAESGLTPYSAN